MAALRRVPLAAFLAALLAAALALPARAAALDNGLARTPPMGWNSWYAYRCDVTEDLVLANARALISSGMAAAGYRYVNVDDCWASTRRTRNGSIQSDPVRFPHGMAWLGRQIHALGLRFGLYTSAGRTTCLHPYQASYGHYRQDFRTFARWKVDYVKVDWCTVPPGHLHPRRTYRQIHQAAAHAGRRMVVAVSIPAHEPWLWAAADGNLWRVADDLTSDWASVLRVADVDAPLYRYSGPGRWNDADILQVGNGVLDATEARTHFSLWCMLDSPLLAGNRLPEMDATTREILTNRDMIAVDQDRLGRQARRVLRRGALQVWSKPLADGSRALMVLNAGDRPLTTTLTLGRVLDLRAPTLRLHDLWTKADLRLARTGSVPLALAPHDSVVWRVSAG